MPEVAFVPPSRVSEPNPPRSVSSPLPPVMTSFASPPLRRSLPAPPSITSAPPRAKTVSSPDPAFIVLTPLSVESVSLSSEPITFSISLTTSVPSPIAVPLTKSRFIPVAEVL